MRRIAAACKDYGVRVQYSLFECTIGQREWLLLLKALLAIVDPERDSLRVYFLGDDEARKTEHYGVRIPLDPTGPLIA